MEAFPIQFCKTIRSYWRRRGYQRLNGSRKSLKIVKLGGGGGSSRGRRRQSWRIRPALRLRLKFLSPLRLLARLRDAYVEAMLGLAGKTRGQLSGFAAPDAFWAKRVPKARPLPEGPGDFERKLVIEIYKSLAASRQLTDF